MFNPIKLLTSKRGINFENINGYKLIRSERLQGSNGERIKLLSGLKSDDGRVVLSSDLYDSKGVLKAYNTFNIDNSNKVLNGYWMRVVDPLEQQKHGYGEVLRLASIIDLMENNLKKIAIFSRNEAILFHYKYKFRPVLSGKDECMDVLNEISYEENPLL